MTRIQLENLCQKQANEIVRLLGRITELERVNSEMATAHLKARHVEPAALEPAPEPPPPPEAAVVSEVPEPQFYTDLQGRKVNKFGRPI